MPQEVYRILEFDWKKTYNRLAKDAERGIVLGDMGDEELGRTKGVLSLYIKANSDKVSFQISPYGTLIISHPDNNKLRKARSKLRRLIVGEEWVPKGGTPEVVIPLISYEARKFHTDQLKLEVIKPWIEQLPTVSTKGIFFQIYGVRCVFGRNSKLEVEGHDLFFDLKNHLHFKPDPFERLELFKMKVGEFSEKREGMLTEIDALVKNEIGLPVSGEWKPGVSNTVHRNLSEKILKVALYLAKGEEEAFSKGLDFKSRMEPNKEKALEYWIDLRACIRVSGEEGEKENFQTEYDIKVKRMMQTMKKNPYKGKAIEIAEVVQELERLKEDMKSVLNKHLNTPILPGDCDRLLLYKANL